MRHDQLRKSTLVFGPGDSYYARTPDSYVWNNLPNDLETEILNEMGPEGLGPPIMVTLGISHTWVAFWDNGRRSWNLGGRYDDVHQCLSDESKSNDGIVSVTLSPYNDDFFIDYRNGFLHWRVNVNDKNMKKFREMCYEYMQTRAREDNTIFRFQAWPDGALFKTSMVISPTTKFDSWSGRGSISLMDPNYWISDDFRSSEGPKFVLFGVAIGAGAVLLTRRRRLRLNANGFSYRYRRFFKKSFEWLLRKRP